MQLFSLGVLRKEGFKGNILLELLCRIDSLQCYNNIIRIMLFELVLEQCFTRNLRLVFYERSNISCYICLNI